MRGFLRVLCGVFFSLFIANLSHAANFKTHEEIVRLFLNERPKPGNATEIIDLRAFDTAVRNQKTLPRCTAFGLLSVFENLVRQWGYNHDLSESYIWDLYNAGNAGKAFGAAFGYYIPDRTSYGGVDNRWTHRKRVTEFKNLSTRFGRTSLSEQDFMRYLTQAQWRRFLAMTPARNARGAQQAQDYLAARLNENADLQRLSGILSSLRNGAPVYFSTETNPTWGARNNGIIRANGRVTGSHAVSLVGYVADPRLAFMGGGYYMFKNSWGSDWGDHGYGYIAADYCQRYDCLAFQLWHLWFRPRLNSKTTKKLFPRAYVTGVTFDTEAGGLKVTEVRDQFPAKQAGVQVGDLIVSGTIGKYTRQIRQGSDLDPLEQRAVSQKRPYVLTVQRGARRLELRVRMHANPQFNFKL